MERPEMRLPTGQRISTPLVVATRQTYSVEIVRKKGVNPITKEPISEARQTQPIEAESVQKARNKAVAFTSLVLRGAEVEVFVNGELVLGNL